MNPQLTNSSSSTQQGCPRVSLPPQNWDYRHLLLCLVLCVGAGDPNLGPHACAKSTFWPSHLPRPIFFYYAYSTHIFISIVLVYMALVYNILLYIMHSKAMCTVINILKT